MYVTVLLDGGQGFLPKLDSKKQYGAFAQDILDRYGNTEYEDKDAIEYFEVDKWYYRLKHWLKAFPFV